MNYPDLKDFTNACGQSRLHGGMHFTASVDNAYPMCKGIGDEAMVWMKTLINGQAWSIESTPMSCTEPSAKPVEVMHATGADRSVKCSSNVDCFDKGYCSPNKGTCAPFKREGAYCNTVQLCALGFICEKQMCAKLSCA
jgi:hypothetical protein